ncbi:MAG: pilus assembly protein PilM [Patescibacteria group bacterium]
MKLFASSASYLGIDIGTSSIKMVELENLKGQAKLKTYGYADVATNIMRGTVEKNNQAIADYINLIAHKSRIETKQVIAALPTFSVFNFIISLPPMPKKDLAAAIKWEAKKFIPVPIEEMILDWKILNKKKIKPSSGAISGLFNKKIGGNQASEEMPNSDEPSAKGNVLNDMVSNVAGTKNDDKNYRILLTAAPKNLVARYIDIFKKAKLNLLSLETEAFALSRSLIGNDTSTIMVVDIGSSNSDICIIEDGVPVLNRGIDTGGESITKAIMNSLNINQDRAEQFKRDFGLAATGSNQNIPDVIQKSLNSIINEIKYIFEIYQRQGATTIDKIILTGGSAWLPNLPQYLSDLLKLPVVIGDPWDRIIYPLDLKPVLQEIGPRMAVSIGLAMRDI